MQRWQAHGGDVNALAHNEMGTLLASAGSDGLLRVWEAGTARRVAVLRPQQAKHDAGCVMLSVDFRGELVVAGQERTGRRWWACGVPLWTEG
jgi:WD40 repeat protein